MLCRCNTAKHVQIRKGFPEQGKCPQHIAYETTGTPRKEINVLYDHRQVRNSFPGSQVTLNSHHTGTEIAPLLRDLGLTLLF